LENILRILIADQDNHPIKAITHEKVLLKFLGKDTVKNSQKWIHLLNKILLPIR
jgi:hypothetical protein